MIGGARLIMGAKILLQAVTRPKVMLVPALSSANSLLVLRRFGGDGGNQSSSAERGGLERWHVHS